MLARNSLFAMLACSASRAHCVAWRVVSSSWVFAARRSSSILRRSLMSRAMPTRPTTRPSESRRGTLVDRNQPFVPSARASIASLLRRAAPLDRTLRSSSSIRRGDLRRAEVGVRLSERALRGRAKGHEVGAVVQDEPARGVLHVDAVGQRVDERLQEMALALERLLRQLARRDVTPGHDDGLLRTERHRRERDLHPELRTVEPPVQPVEPLGPLGQRPGNQLLGPLRREFAVGLAGRREIPRRAADDLLPAGPQHRERRGVALADRCRRTSGGRRRARARTPRGRSGNRRRSPVPTSLGRCADRHGRAGSGLARGSHALPPIGTEGPAGPIPATEGRRRRNSATDGVARARGRPGREAALAGSGQDDLDAGGLEHRPVLRGEVAVGHDDVGDVERARAAPSRPGRTSSCRPR